MLVLLLLVAAILLLQSLSSLEVWRRAAIMPTFRPLCLCTVIYSAAWRGVLPSLLVLMMVLVVSLRHAADVGDET